MEPEEVKEKPDRPPIPDTASWSALTALVLGGTGMIGRHVVGGLLRRGAGIRVLVRPGSRALNLRGLPLERFDGDLDDPASMERALQGCDLLFHCAAPYPRGHFGKARQVARAVAGLEATLLLARRQVPEELLNLPRGHLRRRELEQAEGAASAIRHQPAREQALRDQVRSPQLIDPALDGRLDASLHPPLDRLVGLPGLKRIVYVSSSTTIGRPRGRTAGAGGRDRPADEGDRHDRIHASSPYFQMKDAMESVVTRAAVEGLPVVIGNPTFCVDAYDAAPTSGTLLLAVARRRLPFYFPGMLNVVATRDVGEALVNAAFRGRTGQRYILGGENLEVRSFLELVAEAAGVPPPRIPFPLALAEGVGYLTEVANLVLRRPWPLLPVSGVQMLRHSQPFDCTLAREELHLPATSIPLAVAAALGWFRENGYL